MKLIYLTSALASANIIDFIATKQGNEFASALANHGCHCKKLADVYDKDNVGGSPVDALDAVCRDYFSAKSCTKLIGGKCQDADVENLSTTTPYGGSLFNYWNGLGFTVCPETLYGEDTCGDELCQNSKNFVDQVIAYGSDVSALQQNAQCTSVETAPKSHCCGDFPSLVKYSEDEGVCVNGELQEAPQQAPAPQPAPAQINWATATKTFTSYLSYTARGSIAVDDNYYYIPSRDDKKKVYKNAPVVFALDKTSGSLERMSYRSDTTYKGDYIHSVGISGNFIIGTDTVNNHVVVWDKDVGGVSYSTLEGCNTLSVDGDKVLVSGTGSDQALYTIDSSGLLTLVANFPEVRDSHANVFHNGKVVLSGIDADDNFGIFVYDENNNFESTLTGHTGRVYIMRTWGNYLITSSNDKTIKIWENGSVKATLPLSNNAWGMDASDGYIVLWKDNNKLDIHNIDEVVQGNNDPLHTITDAGKQCSSIKIDTEKGQLVANCRGTVYYWNFSTGTTQPVLDPTSEAINSVDSILSTFGSTFDSIFGRRR